MCTVPVRTGQNWNLQTEERAPAARGRYPYVRQRKKKVFVCTQSLCCQHIFSHHVQHSRLRRVRRPGVVADVLRGMEDAEGQPSQEVSRGKKACHWAESKARAG